jgi:hypothetical protein
VAIACRLTTAHLETKQQQRRHGARALSSFIVAASLASSSPRHSSAPVATCPAGTRLLQRRRRTALTRSGRRPLPPPLALASRSRHPPVPSSRRGEGLGGSGRRARTRLRPRPLDGHLHLDRAVRLVPVELESARATGERGGRAGGARDRATRSVTNDPKRLDSTQARENRFLDAADDGRGDAARASERVGTPNRRRRAEEPPRDDSSRASLGGGRCWCCSWLERRGRVWLWRVGAPLSRTPRRDSTLRQTLRLVESGLTPPLTDSTRL